MGDLFTHLHQLNMDFNTKADFGKDVIQEKVFFSLQNAFICWGSLRSHRRRLRFADQAVRPPHEQVLRVLETRT